MPAAITAAGSAGARGAGPGAGLARAGRSRGLRQVSGAARRAGMAEQWDLDEEGVRRLGALTLEQPGRARPGVPGRRAGVLRSKGEN